MGLVTVYSTKLSYVVTFLLIWMACCVRSDEEPSKKPKVIMVSMDGFRYDYLTKVDAPNFRRMLGAGVTMPWINNTFTTLTFPSHFTMVTGLYEESHGIIGNNMYDETMNNHYFKMSTTDSDWWSGHDTIWTTAKKAGLKTGVYFWVGSSSVINGLLPDRYFEYNGSVPFEDRVDTLIDWMSRDDFDLGLIYFDEPDHTGHTNGPFGEETLDSVKRMDGILGRLLDGLDEANLTDVVNLIVTSDHGMADTDSDNQIIDLRDHVDTNLILKVVMQGPAVVIRPKPGKAQELVDSLRDVDHMRAWLKEDIPDRFHYKDNRRVYEVFLLADEGWTISENKDARDSFMPRFLGDHGFDNNLDSMKPIFIARGPVFKENVTVDPIQTVDIYPLLCHILNLKPAPNNGSLERTASLLRDGSTVSITPTIGNNSTVSITPTIGNNNMSIRPEVCLLLTVFMLLFVKNCIL